MELKFDITEERIDEALRDTVGTMVGNAVEFKYGSMRGAVEHFIADEISKLVREEAEGRFDEIVGRIVSEFMERPVDLNDGWSRTEHYDTYEDFISAKLRDRFARDYKLRDEFREQLKAKVDKVWEQYQKDAIAMLLAKANALSKAE